MNFNYNYPQLAREAGFRLRQYKDGPLDWRLLGSFEIERLMRDQNLEDVDKALVHLSEAPLGSALIETNILDSGIAKYFVVSQFGIQYLLFCRNFLDETVQELRESHTEAQFEIARLKKLLSEANNEILQLHKKMTQMEAIHEVIYPCHLCTKNFANNEALNIHIARKHGGGSNSNNEALNRNKIPTPPKERAKDLTLINTIKLELEIKQLKERLNNAEKEIKSRAADNYNTNSSKNTTPREVERRNVAIQSNLTEEKEKNEAKTDELYEADMAERQKQLEKLQSKIYDIEEWRATQLANNEESIAEIKRRLSDIAHTLEQTTAANRPIETPISAAAVIETNERSLERRLSVDDLERVLSEKVAEIGKANNEKLAEIVHSMELNYRDKLFELEREVKAATKIQSNQELKPVEARVVIKPAPRVKRVTASATSAAGFEDEILQITKSDDDGGENTYSIELKDAKTFFASIGNKALEPKTALPTSSLESNHTFVKVVEPQKKTHSQQSKVSMESSSDTTDISESLSEDEKNEQRAQPIAKPRLVDVTKILEDSMKKSESTKSSKMQRAKSPKKFTRKDAKSLTAKRLEKFGCDMRSKSLPRSTLKRVNGDLQEKRNKLRQKYPNYFATRNRIKKFVDKLCSRKLPKKAEKILSNKKALQPNKGPKSFSKQTINEQSTSDESEQSSDEHEPSSNDTSQEIANEAQQQKKDDFKKRLELLLASPVKRPLNMGLSSSSKAVLMNKPSLNEEKPLILTKPMPVPRKRVMFDTAAGGQL